ncbi:MAG: pyruvate kinase [Candidatus Pacebacteria bacterium]|nr:pyruvate kinase [Candidatus Paceibacterota bacterium]
MNPQIIVTIGPKSEDYETLKAMAESGMNIARLNFSHATCEQWQRVRQSLSQIREETGIDIKMMMDLQGPRIRVGNFPKKMNINKGETYTLFYGKANTLKRQIPIDHPDLFRDVKVGEHFYIANGSIEMEITKISGKKIIAIAHRGGVLIQRKGINIPETNLSGGVLGEKDLADAKFGAENGADYICLSFVQTSKDIKELRNILEDELILIIAKIERATALNDIDNIIKSSDGIMIARGDLGIEVPIEEIPMIQKDLIRHAHQHGKPAIVATEMLASMIDQPHPTRAEVTDIANAIFDGADATMLSDETTSGNYPVEAVQTMKKIAERADKYFHSNNYLEQGEVS